MALAISASAGGALLVLGFLLLPMKEYQKDRLLGFLYPEQNPHGAGYMILQVKELLVQVGWFGNTVQPEFIPDAYTNFIFISFTYYYGWLFAAVLVFILSLFVARIAIIVPAVHDSYGRLLLVGAAALYAVQLLSNIAMAFGWFPPTSIPLPFISYGLMPILLNAVLMGSVLSVYRRKDLTRVRAA